MTKAEILYKKLLERLENGDYPPESRFPSEYLLAEEYGVDKKTANKAVSMLAADGIVKRGLRGAGTIVVKKALFPKGYLAFIANFFPYTMKILNGVQKTALGNGYAVAVFFPSELDYKQYIDNMRDSSIRGIIAAGAPSELAIGSPLPLISVDYDAIAQHPHVNMVNTNNYQGGLQMMREVIRRGHRNIVLYSSSREFLDRQGRVKGFMDAMLSAGIPSPRKRLFYGSRFNEQEAIATLKKIHRMYPDATILVCDSDDAAESMIRAAAHLRIRLPEDIAVTSYGNTLLTAFPTASVEQFPEEIGSLACNHLIEIIENGVSGSVIREYVTPRVVNPQFIPDLTLT